MYWYTRKESNLVLLDKVAELDASGELDAMDPHKRKELAEKLVALQNQMGKNFYEPNRKLYKWFLMPYMIKGVVAGNRAGKTTATVVDVIMQCEGWHPLQRENLVKLTEEAIEEWVRVLCQKILDTKKWIKSPPVSARIVTVDYDNYVEKVIGPEIEKWASKDLLKDVQYDNEKRRRVTWKNGSRLEFMTYKQDIAAHGGAARDTIVFDEEPPNKDLWSENLMRVISTKGRMTLGMTAVNGVTWTEDEIWVPGLQGKKNTYAIEMTTYDNPMNDEKTVNMIKSKCIDDVDVDIRIYGKRRARGGSVYKTYKDKYPWVVPWFKIPSNEGLLVMAIDPHPKTAHAVLWAWIDTDGYHYPLFDDKPNIYFIDAIFQNNHIPGLAATIKMKEAASIGRVHDICLCDPSAWITDQTRVHSKSIVDQLNDAEIFPIKGSKDLAGGILKVNEMLSLEWVYENRGKVTRERPQAMILTTDEGREDGLGRLRWEIKNYRWASPSINSKIQSVREKPVDKDDHLVEDHRRIIEYVVEGNFETESIFDLKPPAIKMDGQLIDINYDSEEENWVNSYV